MTRFTPGCRADDPSILRRARELERLRLCTREGEIGRIKDYCFDAPTWEIRCLVVETGDCLDNRTVLISPEVVAAPVWTDFVIPVRLTLDELMEDAPMNETQPLSPEHGNQGRGLPGGPGGGYAGIFGAPGPVSGSQLQRMNALVGARLQATDGEVGHVSGFLIDDVRWSIQFLVADVGHSLSGHQVLLTPDQVSGMDPMMRSVTLGIDLQAVKESSRYEFNEAPTLENVIEFPSSCAKAGLAFPVPQTS